MSYDIEGLKSGNNAPGATLETSDKEATPAGLYRHPESGEELITKDHPLFGNAQSEGVIRAGFKFVRSTDPNEHKSIVEQILEGRLGAQEDLKGFSARLRELEAESDMAKKDREELGQLREEKRLREMNASSDAGESKTDAVKAGEEQGEKLVKTNGTATDLAGDTTTATPKQTEKKATK